MMGYDWQEHWKSAEHPFHLEKVNPLLEQYWQSLQLPRHANVLVPLCGKTLDLLWLEQQGYHVIGVEISAIACEAFFIENSIAFQQHHQGAFTHYKSEAIDLYCGDFFSLDHTLLPDIAAIYDRAALVALPKAFRQRYAKQLNNLMSPDTKMLLIVMDTLDITQEHPYPLTSTEVTELFADEFKITELARIKIKNISDFLYSRGYRNAFEVVYKLERGRI